MTEKEARNIGAPYWSKYHTVIVDEDKSVYLNVDIETFKKEAKKKNIKFFIVKENGTK
jgi:hypothetical protein